MFQKEARYFLNFNTSSQVNNKNGNIDMKQPYPQVQVVLPKHGTQT